MLSLIDRAIGFAARKHDGQRRKVGSIPYIAHPVGVAMILQQMGCDETIVAAGLLHDVVEDTNATLEDVRVRFGDEVADIVAGCTELPKKRFKWEVRKNHMIGSLRDAPLSVKLVAAADKYHNLSHSLHNVNNNNPGLWKHFGKGIRQQAWYYRSVLKSIIANIPHPEQYPIFDQLAAVVDELFDGVSPLPPT